MYRTQAVAGIRSVQGLPDLRVGLVGKIFLKLPKFILIFMKTNPAGITILRNLKGLKYQNFLGCCFWTPFTMTSCFVRSQLMRFSGDNFYNCAHACVAVCILYIFLCFYWLQYIAHRLLRYIFIVISLSVSPSLLV